MPRHFERREWASIFDQLMNHDDFTCPLEMLESTFKYFEREYVALEGREKQAFQKQFQKYIQTK